jgi:hypothetical protein
MSIKGQRCSKINPTRTSAILFEHHSSHDLVSRRWHWNLRKSCEVKDGKCDDVKTFNYENRTLTKSHVWHNSYGTLSPKTATNIAQSNTIPSKSSPVQLPNLQMPLINSHPFIPHPTPSSHKPPQNLALPPTGSSQSVNYRNFTRRSTLDA